MSKNAGDAPADAGTTNAGDTGVSQDTTIVKPIVLDDAFIGDNQGIEVIDEKLLMGEEDADATDDTSTGDKTADPGSKDDKTEDKDKDKAEDKDKAGDKTGDQDKDKDKTGDQDKDKDKTGDQDKDKTGDQDKAEDKDKDKKEPETPPKGYVKLEALQEARRENKYLKGEIAKLKVQNFESQQQSAPVVKSLVTPEEAAEFKDFKVLSNKEFEETYKEDQAGGMKYLQQLNRFQDFQRRQTEQKLAEQEATRDLEATAAELQGIYDATETQMEKILPGIFDDPKVREEFQDFAVDLGFTEEMFYLTNPETRIILPGEAKPLVLGEQAADILQLLVTTRTKLQETASDKPDIEALKKEWEATARKDIEAELLKKFKDAGKDKTFTSIDDIPTSESENKYAGQIVSEADFARMSEAEQEKYLAGA